MISVLEKLSLFRLTVLISLVDGSLLEEKSSFKMLELSFSSKLDWSSYIVSIAKTDFKEIGGRDWFWEVFFSRCCFL